MRKLGRLAPPTDLLMNKPPNDTLLTGHEAIYGKDLLLFTDGSAHPQLKIGYGAYLAFDDPHCSTETLQDMIKIRRFENTSSSRLELQTMLWALEDVGYKGKEITIYTDSQAILGLAARRKRIEENNYRSKSGNALKNADLYQRFFRMIDQLDCLIMKVKGHLPAKRKDKIDRLFKLVDKAARKALKRELMQ